MDYAQFKDACFREALALGCDAAETYYSSKEAFSVNILNADIETYEVNTRGGLNLRVKLGGRDGYAYTEKLDEPEKLVERAMDNARSIEGEDTHPMQGKSEYGATEHKQNKVNTLAVKDKIDLALNMEKAVKAYDERVARTLMCGVTTERNEVRISNTLGLDAHDASTETAALLMPVTIQDGDVRNAFAFRLGDDVFDTEGIVSEAVQNSLMQHGAAPVSAGEYRVMFRNDAMTELLAAFSPMFSADDAQKGLSLFRDRLGESVACDKVNITDDPLYPGRERAFDAEGVPSATTRVVEKGVLKSFLHNLKTAAKAGVASTSNGGRRSASAAVSVTPSVFYIEPGDVDFDTMLSMLGDGLLICELGGLHAGLSTISGEFSLIAKGMLVEGGKPVRAVEQITVGGSFMTMLNSVLAVGSDLRFGLPQNSTFGSPSILVDGLMVSGE